MVAAAAAVVVVVVLVMLRADGENVRRVESLY